MHLKLYHTLHLLQIKLNVLKEEKRILMQHLKSGQRGDDASLLLPPSLDGELTDMSEDELEGRLASLKHTGFSRSPRKRSESREFARSCSYFL